MKAINNIISLLIVFVPVILVVYFNTVLIREYIQGTEFFYYYAVFESILITYIICQFIVYSIKFNEWFDSKLN